LIERRLLMLLLVIMMRMVSLSSVCNDIRAWKIAVGRRARDRRCACEDRRGYMERREGLGGVGRHHVSMRGWRECNAALLILEGGTEGWAGGIHGGRLRME
jgi:hypothetical protein